MKVEITPEMISSIHLLPRSYPLKIRYLFQSHNRVWVLSILGEGPTVLPAGTLGVLTVTMFRLWFRAILLKAKARLFR